jgi:hypothetical protein
MLGSLSDEVKAPIITPQAERYPPLAPSNKKEASSPTKSIEKVAKKPRYSILYNLITVLMILAAIAFIAWFVVIWNNPQSSFNPLPPATPYIILTATPGEPTFSQPATPDDTGQIFVVITDTPAPNSLDRFIAYDMRYIPNSNAMACDWWSIAGSVKDRDGNALNGYRIRVTGNEFSETVFSGTTPSFGAGGFELPLIGTPQAAEFTVQLFSPQEVALSEALLVTTHPDCDANVALINFAENP